MQEVEGGVVQDVVVEGGGQELFVVAVDRLRVLHSAHLSKRVSVGSILARLAELVHLAFDLGEGVLHSGLVLSDLGP